MFRDEEDEIEFCNDVDIVVENRILAWFTVALIVKALIVAVCWYYLLGEL